MSKSLFGQLCAYLMSCDTHHRTCPRYLPKECSRQVSKKFEKYFSSYCADKHGHTDGQTDRRTDRQTDRQTDRRTDAGNDNTPPALGPRGKNGTNETDLFREGNNVLTVKKYEPLIPINISSMPDELSNCCFPWPDIPLYGNCLKSTTHRWLSARLQYIHC